jgi:hypothetical protein
MELTGSLLCSQELSTSSYPEPDQPSPQHHSLRFIPILFTHLHLGIPIGLFPSGFPTNNLYAFLIMLHAFQSHPPSPDHSKYTWQRVQVTKLLIMHLSPTSCHFLSPPCKCYPQHPVLKHPQSNPPLMSKTQVLRLYSPVYSNFYMFTLNGSRTRSTISWLISCYLEFNALFMKKHLIKHRKSKFFKSI